MSAYATGAQLVERYDIDLIGDLTQDNREDLDREAVATHPNVLAALLDATGEVDAALLSGGMYTPEQLAGLTGNTINHRIRITCAIAMALLVERRPEKVSMELAEMIRKSSRAHLELLRKGVNVFGIPAVIGSGALELATVSAVEIDNLNLLPGRMSRYFPGTAQRTPRFSS